MPLARLVITRSLRGFASRWSWIASRQALSSKWPLTGTSRTC